MHPVKTDVRLKNGYNWQFQQKEQEETICLDELVRGAVVMEEWLHRTPTVKRWLPVAPRMTDSELAGGAIIMNSWDNCSRMMDKDTETDIRTDSDGPRIYGLPRHLATQHLPSINSAPVTD